MKKTTALLGGGVFVLSFALAGCGGAGEETQAADAISRAMLAEADEDMVIEQEQADCVGEGLVDAIGVEQLKEYGILTDGGGAADSPLDGVTMNEGDADDAAAVMVDCLDAEAMMAEELGADEEMTEEQRACVQEVMDAAALERTFSLTLQGREDEAGQELLAPMMDCLLGDL